jgi:hypothetical protein
MLIEKPYQATDETGTVIYLNQPAARIVCLTATGIDFKTQIKYYQQFRLIKKLM